MAMRARHGHAGTYRRGEREAGGILVETVEELRRARFVLYCK